MTVAAGNVRPQPYASGAGVAGIPAFTISYAGNYVYVVTGVVVSLIGASLNDYANVTLNGAVLAMCVVAPADVSGIATTQVIDRFTGDAALGNVDVMQFTAVTAAGKWSYGVYGYFWADDTGT